MKVYNKIRGTMETVPNIEVNIDTVYIRSNITQINEDNFKGWEYDETQYDIREYIELTSDQTQNLGQQLAQEKLLNMQKDSVINELGQQITDLKLQVIKLQGGTK